MTTVQLRRLSQAAMEPGRDRPGDPLHTPGMSHGGSSPQWSRGVIAPETVALGGQVHIQHVAAMEPGRDRHGDQVIGDGDDLGLLEAAMEPGRDRHGDKV